MMTNATVCKMRSRPRVSSWVCAWLPLLAACAGCEPLESAPAFAERSRGALLAAQYQCGACHVIPGVAAARGTLAVSLEGMGRRSFIAGRIPNRDPLLARWIADPASLVPDTAMPTLGVSLDEATAIAAFLRELH